MKLGRRKNLSAIDRLMADPDYIARQDSARNIALQADLSWQWYARKVGIDHKTFVGSPLDVIESWRGVVVFGRGRHSKRPAVIESGEGRC